MSKEYVIDVGATGKVTALHNDQFSLSFLGAQKIQRASDIRFNEETQLWDIYLRDEAGVEYQPTPALSGFDTYDGARTFEVQALNHIRKSGLRAGSLYAFAAIEALRFIDQAA